MLSCAQLPLARTPTYWCSHAVAATEPIQPSRQAVVPAWSRWAAPDRPPNAPPTVTRSKVGRRPGWGATAVGRRPTCACSAVGARAATSAAAPRKIERFNIYSSETGFMWDTDRQFMNERHPRKGSRARAAGPRGHAPMPIEPLLDPPGYGRYERRHARGPADLSLGSARPAAPQAPRARGRARSPPV